MESFDALIKSYPEHVQLICTAEEVDALFAQGRLCDEDVVVAPSVTQKAPKEGGIELAPMKLTHFNAPPKSPKTAVQVKSSVKKATGDFSKIQFVRVWTSKPLKRRDLSIPDDTAVTHPTGYMGFTQDAISKINYHKYFREYVFRELVWTEGTKPYQELAIARFDLVLAGINNGEFTLTLSHITGPKAAARIKAHNFVTDLRWGDAKQIIAKGYLLGRTLSLSKKATKPPTYLIEID